MKFPPPAPGLVIRYSYLWAREHASGAEEGRKDRPAAIVMAVKQSDGKTRAYVLPITHSAPSDGTAALEIPSKVAQGLGLDSGPHWIILSEFSVFEWPGFDLRLVPGSNPKSIAYGFMPSGFFAKVRDTWLELDSELKSRKLPRDP